MGYAKCRAAAFVRAIDGAVLRASVICKLIFSIRVLVVVTVVAFDDRAIRAAPEAIVDTLAIFFPGIYRGRRRAAFFRARELVWPATRIVIEVIRIIIVIVCTVICGFHLSNPVAVGVVARGDLMFVWRAVRLAALVVFDCYDDNNNRDNAKHTSKYPSDDFTSVTFLLSMCALFIILVVVLSRCLRNSLLCGFSGHILVPIVRPFGNLMRKNRDRLRRVA